MQTSSAMPVGDQPLAGTVESYAVEMIKRKKDNLLARCPVIEEGVETDLQPGQRLRAFLQDRGLTFPQDATHTRGAVDGLLTLSLLSSLKVSPQALGELQMVDRCLLSLLTIDPGKAMSTGRLAWLASDVFVEMTVNLVRERMAAIGATFAANGHSGLLGGDYETGFYLKV